MKRLARPFNTGFADLEMLGQLLWDGRRTDAAADVVSNSVLGIMSIEIREVGSIQALAKKIYR
jgi:hypothetical protein